MADCCKARRSAASTSESTFSSRERDSDWINSSNWLRCSEVSATRASSSATLAAFSRADASAWRAITRASADWVPASCWRLTISSSAVFSRCWVFHASAKAAVDRIPSPARIHGFAARAWARVADDGTPESAAGASRIAAGRGAPVPPSPSGVTAGGGDAATAEPGGADEEEEEEASFNTAKILGARSTRPTLPPRGRLPELEQSRPSAPPWRCARAWPRRNWRTSRPAGSAPAGGPPPRNC